MDKSARSKLIRLSLIILATGIALPLGGRTASAGYISNLYDNIQQFRELPQEVTELKDSYNQTLQELDRARMNTEKLQQQNAELAEQNRQLTQMVNQLQEAEAARKRGAERLKNLAIAAAALAAGYFLLVRALRFGMRRTNRF
jgi:chromosome segregation ATPase